MARLLPRHAQSMVRRPSGCTRLSQLPLFDQCRADRHTGSLPSDSFMKPRDFTDLFKSFIPNENTRSTNVL